MEKWTLNQVQGDKKIGAQHAFRLCIALAKRLAELLPEDVEVSTDGEAIVIAGKRIELRWLTEAQFAVLRDRLVRLL